MLCALEVEPDRVAGKSVGFQNKNGPRRPLAKINKLMERGEKVCNKKGTNAHFRFKDSN
jgi:hypothetical protein